MYGATPRHPVWLLPAPGRGGIGLAPASAPLPRSRGQDAFRAALQASGVHKRAAGHTLRNASTYCYTSLIMIDFTRLRTALHAKARLDCSFPQASTPHTCRRARPVRTACTSAWTVARLRSVRWIIHGAAGLTWLAGHIPCPISRLRPVALTPTCCAACVSVSQSFSFGKFGRRY
jgi:hypothetical protein